MLLVWHDYHLQQEKDDFYWISHLHSLDYVKKASKSTNAAPVGTRNSEGVRKDLLKQHEGTNHACISFPLTTFTGHFFPLLVSFPYSGFPAHIKLSLEVLSTVIYHRILFFLLLVCLYGLFHFQSSTHGYLTPWNSFTSSKLPFSHCLWRRSLLTLTCILSFHVHTIPRSEYKHFIRGGNGG